ncbi:MAG TPA: hypothetical protein VJY41_06550 [Prolixibacteraceae bacterium]|nr:hypothetical protein [Prolixibacteraceae bacterium]
MTELNQIYTGQIVEGKKKLVRLNRSLIWLSIFRFLFFISALIVPFLLYTLSVFAAVAVPVLLMVFFVVALKYYAKLGRRKEFEQHKLNVNQHELDALQHHFHQFDDGKQYINPEHFYSYDLDLFGRGSLFQFLNRTVTLGGSQLLASFLELPLFNTTQIVDRQQLVKELAGDYQWRQTFAANGKMYAENESENELFSKWEQDDFTLKTFSFANILLLILPVISLFTLLFWIFKDNSSLFVLSGIVQLGLWVVEKKNINRLYVQFGKRANLLKKYGHLLTMIESFNWQSNEGKAMYQKMKKSGIPSVEIRKLEKLIAAFDNRNNIFAGIVLNLIFAWDVRCSYQIIKWHNRNRQFFGEWGKNIAFIDAVCSLSNFTFNHPEYSFPEFTAEFSINSTRMGHPLIRPDKRIDNDFQFSPDSNVIIVTGANMAGKSTFLRTIGVNMVLGMCGAPVCAAAMRFKPVGLFSNMRTTDSLFDDESYFFAELKRIKAILDEIDKGHEMLIILDEILKGTNSVDKLSGSQKLIQRLIKNNVPSIIATHDLKLTEMAKQFQGKVQNKCFEIVIENNEMHFDYQLRDGATSIMNATFLMRKMGIIE